jgi:hypothetical protein
MNCPVGEGARSIEEEHAAKEKIDLAVKYQDKIKHACDRLQALESADNKSVTTFFNELILKMRSEIQDSAQFDDHYWLLAERIKDQIALKSSNPEMSELLLALRDKIIRLAPGRLERAAKAFFQV